VADSPYTVLGVREGASLDECATALRVRVSELAPTLIAAHAEERREPVLAWARLHAAWRAVAARS
jgi:hypothetical protein